MNPVYEKLLKCFECYKNKIDFEPKVAIEAVRCPHCTSELK